MDGVEMMAFQVGDWVRRKKEHRNGLWRKGADPYQVKALDGDGDFWDGPQCWVADRFEPINSASTLSRKQRDTALGMALELARLIDHTARPYLPSGESMEFLLLADWLRDCVTRELWGGE